MHRAALPLLLLLGAVGLASSGAAQTLAVHGRPRFGDSLWLEVVGEPSRKVWLAFDVRPGSGTWKGVALGLEGGAGFGIFKLGWTDRRGWLGRFVPVPVLSDATPLYFQALVRDPSAPEGWSPTPVRRVPLAAPLPSDAIDDYVYQLQGNPSTADLIDVEALAATRYDLVVVDYSKDGSAAQELTPEEVARLKGGPEERKIVLAYLSIGEAEDYRWYWPELPPGILAGSNPQWPGNFKVRYWTRAWREILLTGNEAVGTSYLDRIIDQGFDGVFLDTVDAFEFFGPASEGGTGEKADAALAMMELVLRIARHARVVRGRPEFLVVPQNGLTIFTEGFYPAETLRSFDPLLPRKMAKRQLARLAATIDLLATEDVFFRGDRAENNPLDPDEYVLGLMRRLQAKGRRILATEYLTQRAKIDQFYDSVAPAEGVIPLATVRALDRIPRNPGHKPD